VAATGTAALAVAALLAPPAEASADGVHSIGRGTVTATGFGGGGLGGSAYVQGTGRMRKVGHGTWLWQRQFHCSPEPPATCGSDVSWTFTADSGARLSGSTSRPDLATDLVTVVPFTGTGAAGDLSGTISLRLVHVGHRDVARFYGTIRRV
jgi:hypothetical protein